MVIAGARVPATRDFVPGTIHTWLAEDNGRDTGLSQVLGMFPFRLESIQ